MFIKPLKPLELAIVGWLVVSVTIFTLETLAQLKTTSEG